jgi:hypothetical protein
MRMLMAPVVAVVSVLAGISLGSYFWPDGGGLAGLIAGTVAAIVFLQAPYRRRRQRSGRGPGGNRA